MARKTKKPVLSTVKVLYESANSLFAELSKTRREFLTRLKNTSEPISDEELATLYVKTKCLQWAADNTLENAQRLANYLQPTEHVRENRQQVIFDFLQGLREDDSCDFWSDDKIENLENHF